MKNLKINRSMIVIMIVVIALLMAVVPTFAADAVLPVDPLGSVRTPIAGNVVVFRLDNGDVQVWTPNVDAVWDQVIVLSAAEVSAFSADVPKVNTLIGSSGNIAVYQSAAGEFFVSSGPDFEGKSRIAVFNSAFVYTRQYDNNVYAS